MRKLFKILFVAFILKLVISFLVWHPDVNNHVDWGIRFWQYGPAKFYTANVWSFTWPNQPPGTTYMFAGIRKLYEVLFTFFRYLHFNLGVFPGSFLLYFEQNLYPAMTKLPSILADIGIAYLIFDVIHKVFGKDKKIALLGVLLFLINPATWYNSTIWGQYDSVINFFALLSFYLLIKRKITLSLLAIAVSLYIKASLLIFVPIWFVVALGQKYRIRQWVYAFGISLIIIGLMTLPFSQDEPFVWLFNLYRNKVFTYQLQIITANAFNIWATISGIGEQPQTLPFLGLNYQNWGYIFFALFYFPILWILYKQKEAKTIIWGLALAAFSSFMLLTNMHERYLYPLFPYFTILTAMNIELIANYSAVSLINLLNMYNFWWVPFIPPLVNFLSFSDRVVPRILGGVNFILFVFLFIRFIRQTKLARL